MAYLAFNLFSTDTVFRCIWLSLECHWVATVVTHRKQNKNEPIIPSFFSCLSGICISKNRVCESTKKICLMDDLEMRMEIVNAIAKIWKWSTTNVYSAYSGCTPSLGSLGATALGGRWCLQDQAVSTALKLRKHWQRPAHRDLAEHDKFCIRESVSFLSGLVLFSSK